MFSSEFLVFLNSLSNNNKDWFNTNKKDFKEFVEAPFLNFVDNIILKFKKELPNLKTSSKECVFTIYKDPRFIKEKAPYKDFLSAYIGPGGKKKMDSRGFYLEVSNEEIRVYSGLHHIGKNELFSLRQYIADNLADFKKLYTSKTFKKNYGEILGEKNKRIPKEFVSTAKEEPLLYNKSLYFYSSIPIGNLYDKNLVEQVIKIWKISQSINDFLRKGMGL